MALFNVTSTSIATRNVANAEPMKPPRPAHILSSLINSVFSIFFLHFYFIFIFIFFICTAWFAYTLSWRNRRHIEGMKRSSSMLNMHPAYRIGRAYQSGLDYVHRDNKSYSCYGKNQKKKHTFWSMSTFTSALAEPSKKCPRGNSQQLQLRVVTLLELTLAW